MKPNRNLTQSAIDRATTPTVMIPAEQGVAPAGHIMRLSNPIIAVVLFTGCTAVPHRVGLLPAGPQVPAEFAANMSEAAEKYSSVTLDMTKKEVIAILGPPQKEVEHVATWELRYDSGNYESLSVDFGSSGAITKITKTRKRESFTGPREVDLTR